MNLDHTLLANTAAGGLSVNELTQYLFWIGFIAMASGTAFFWLSKNDVLPKYRSTLIVSGLITGIAAYHYFTMANVYKSGEFPTEYRYIDWIITTPLMLIKFPMLLGLGAKGKKWLMQLVVLDLIMIVTAYIAEVSEIASGTWWTFFLVAVVAWAAIIGCNSRVLEELSKVPPRLSRRGFGKCGFSSPSGGSSTRSDSFLLLREKTEEAFGRSHTMLLTSSTRLASDWLPTTL